MTAVAACAGGGFVLGGSSGASGAAPTTPVVLDHYLCAGHLGSGDCNPVKVELPDSTTFTVNDPLGHLVCRTSRHTHRHHGDPTAVELTNELTSLPVTLDVGHERAECTIVDPPAANPMHSHAHRAHDNAAAVASFTCFSVGYSSDGSHFTPPDPVTLDSNVTAHVGDPRRLCTPNDPNATSPAGTDLLCFDVQVDEAQHHHRHHQHAVLCVPSSDPNGSIPPSVTTTTSAPTSTSTTTTTTTTTVPTTTTASTTTTTASTTTTTASTTTTTTTGTTTPTTQPCVGTIINGQCVING